MRPGGQGSAALSVAHSDDGRAHSLRSTTVDIDWTRYDGQTDPPQAIGGDKRTVVLRPGERHVLEVVDLRRGHRRDERLHRDRIAVRRRAAGPSSGTWPWPTMSGWSTKRRPGRNQPPAGPGWSRRSVGAVRLQAPLAPARHGAAVDGTAGLMQVILDGSLKVRAKTDGTFDLVVDTNRTLTSMPGMKAVEGGRSSSTPRPKRRSPSNCRSCSRASTTRRRESCCLPARGPASSRATVACASTGRSSSPGRRRLS